MKDLSPNPLINTADAQPRGRVVTVDSVLPPSASMVIIPHRGGSNIAPEGTLSAYKQAVEISPFVDTDLHPLYGGGLACIHDDNLNFTNAPTGLDVTKLSVPEFTSFRYTAESWFAPYWPQREYPLTQEDVFRIFGNTVIYTPEIKYPNDGLTGPRLLTLIQKYKLEKNVIVQANTVAALTPFVAAGIATCLGSISSDSVAASFPASTLVANGIKFASVSQACSDTTFNNYVTGGVRVFGWTIDRHYQRDRLAALTNPPCAIFTNEPRYQQADATTYQRSTNSFEAGRFLDGMQVVKITGGGASGTPTRNGTLAVSPGSLDLGNSGIYFSLLHGYLPVPANGQLTLTFQLQYSGGTPTDTGRWSGFFISANSDRDWTDPGAAGGSGQNGYGVYARMSGGVVAARYTDGVQDKTGTESGTRKAWTSGAWQTFTVTITSSTVTISHSGGSSYVLTDNKYRSSLTHIWSMHEYDSSVHMALTGITLS